MLRNRSESDLWNYVTALQYMQETLFQLEKNEPNPDVLAELATRALAIGKELEEILLILKDKVEE